MMNKLLLIFLILSCVNKLSSQTLILDPNGEGGFENGSSFGSNGWSVANGTLTNTWNIGNVPVGRTGNRCAYISQDNGITHTYNITSGTKVYLWRDIDLTTFSSSPAIILEFDWMGQGESGWDDLEVYKINTNNTPTAGSNLNNPRTKLGGPYGENSNWSTASIDLSSYAGTVIRLVFAWKCGTTSGVQPPHAIDNVIIYQGVYPLPVELVSFSGRCNGNDHLLEWTTGSESNNDYFTLESTMDGKNWQYVADIKGSGNSNEIRYYSCRVFSEQISLNPFYRLKQTDFNGNFKYSDIVRIENDCDFNFAETRISPNPSEGNFLVEANFNIESIKMINPTGQVVLEVQNISENKVAFNISAFPKGIYYLVLKNENVSETRKILLR